MNLPLDAHRLVLATPTRRLFVTAAVAGLLLPTLASLPAPAAAHEYPEAGFKIIHPWCLPAAKGSDELVVSLNIVEISVDDRLLAASTPVATAMEWRRVAASNARGVALRSGKDLKLSAATDHLVLRNVNTELRFGYEYPLTLVFERAGKVDAALIVGQH